MSIYLHLNILVISHTLHVSGFPFSSPKFNSYNNITYVCVCVCVCTSKKSNLQSHNYMCNERGEVCRDNLLSGRGSSADRRLELAIHRSGTAGREGRC